jgi:hypothetical protein
MTTDLSWEAKESVMALADALTNASTSFDIWAVLQNGSKRHEYEPVVGKFPVFFETTVVAHLIAMSALLYSVCETRSDTHNIPGLFKLAKQLFPASTELLEYEKLLVDVKPLWIKLGRIRNEVFGHRKTKQYPVEVFVEIQLLPNEIATIIRVYKEILVGVSELLGIEVPSALKLGASAETEQIMLVLSRANAA